MIPTHAFSYLNILQKECEQRNMVGIWSLVFVFVPILCSTTWKIVGCHDNAQKWKE